MNTCNPKLTEDIRLSCSSCGYNVTRCVRRSPGTATSSGPSHPIKGFGTIKLCHLPVEQATCIFSMNVTLELYISPAYAQHEQKQACNRMLRSVPIVCTEKENIAVFFGYIFFHEQTHLFCIKSHKVALEKSWIGYNHSNICEGCLLNRLFSQCFAVAPWGMLDPLLEHPQ